MYSPGPLFPLELKPKNQEVLMGRGLVLYWLIPVLPGLANLAVAWGAEKGVFGRNLPSWQLAHRGRLAGVGVFALSGWLFHRYGLFGIPAFVKQQFPVSFQELLVTLLMVSLLTALQVVKGKKTPPAGLENYVGANLSARGIWNYGVAWVAYLLCYEAYFRGYLLFSAFQGAPQWGLVVFNLVLYALVHVYKSAQQVVAAIPFGLLLCLVTFWSGHLWFAWVVHSWLALGFELPLLTKSATRTFIK